MFSKVYAIVLNTFREAVRSKILSAILFFAIVLILLSLVFGELSLHQQERVLKDLGIVVITLFSALIAIFTGVSLLHKEIDKKTIYTIVSKPIERWQFLIGKYLGILLTMAVEMLVMSAIFVGLLLIKQIEITPTLFQALLLIFVEVSVVAALAMLFSSFSSPFLSGLMTSLLFLLGNVHETIAAFSEQQESPLIRVVLNIAEFALPDLTLFNLSTEVTYNTPVPWDYVGYASLHAFTYIAVMMIIGGVIIHRRDFI